MERLPLLSAYGQVPPQYVPDFGGSKHALPCQQKRQQRCWKGAALGIGGVELDSIAKPGIFRAENALEATDSDPRLQRLTQISSFRAGDENRPSPRTPDRERLGMNPCLKAAT